MKKKPFSILAGSVFICVLAIAFLAVLSSCGSGSKSDSKNNTAVSDTGSTTDNTNTTTEPTVTDTDADNNGIRDDIEAYIDETYTSGTQKNLALRQYAAAIQNAYSNVTSEEEARTAEEKIIRALSCVTKIGEDSGTNYPSDMVDEMTTNTPERLQKEIDYENLVKGDFTVSSPGETAQDDCDFNLDSTPE